MRLPFFRKRNKEDKSKQTRVEAPPKDASNNTPTSAAALGASTSSADTVDGKAVVNADGKGSPDEETVRSQEKMKLDERIKELGLDFFTEDFEGVTVSSTKCLSCETVTEQKETMIDLSVPITGYENLDAIENPHQFIQVSLWLYFFFIFFKFCIDFFFGLEPLHHPRALQLREQIPMRGVHRPNRSHTNRFVSGATAIANHPAEAVLGRHGEDQQFHSNTVRHAVLLQ